MEDSFTKVLIKSFAVSAVTTAGMFVGIMAAGYIVSKFDERKTKKNHDKTIPENKIV